jgi:hypothetical protein
VSGCLFVTNQHVRDFTVFVQGIVDVEYGSTGVAKNIFDIFELKGSGDHLAT